jgi:hypothetical protein
VSKGRRNVTIGGPDGDALPLSRCRSIQSRSLGRTPPRPADRGF